MGTNRQAGIEWLQTVPVRMTVDVYSIKPRRPVMADKPIVRVKGVADLNPGTNTKDLPLWFTAKVQVYEDGTAEILEFEPLHGAIHGPQVGGRLTDIYEYAFRRALADTKLKILDVVQ